MQEVQAWFTRVKRLHPILQERLVCDFRCSLPGVELSLTLI